MKWLLQDVRRRAMFAIKNPRYALGAMASLASGDEGESFWGKDINPAANQ